MIVELKVPDLDLPGVPVIVSAWHVKVGQSVGEGDRILEIAAGDVAVDLAATASGKLVERCARLDEAVIAGQVLARIDTAV